MRINLTERTIALTKKEMTAASRYGSDAYKELQNARRDNPGFEIVTITRMVKTQRETYKGLTYEYMEKYIKTHDDDKQSIMNEYLMLRGKSDDALEIQAGSASFLEIRTWFLKTFPAIEAFYTKRAALLGKAA